MRECASFAFLVRVSGPRLRSKEPVSEVEKAIRGIYGDRNIGLDSIAKQKVQGSCTECRIREMPDCKPNGSLIDHKQNQASRILYPNTRNSRRAIKYELISNSLEQLSRGVRGASDAWFSR